MKKTIKIIVISVIVFFVVSASVALTVSLRRKNTLDEGPKVFITDELSYGEYTFEIIEKSDSFYYPTLSGYVVVKDKPERITCLCNYTESPVEIKSLKFQNGFWIVDFEEEIIYGSLEKGNYPAVINVYGETENVSVNATATLIVDELYTSLAGFNETTGETFYAMDKESHWVGPYHENELPIMPITNGGAFVASGYDGEFI